MTRRSAADRNARYSQLEPTPSTLQAPAGSSRPSAVTVAFLVRVVGDQIVGVVEFVLTSAILTLGSLVLELPEARSVATATYVSDGSFRSARPDA